MNRVVTFMAESCNAFDDRVDLSSLGFSHQRFDLSPVNTSEEALFHLQTFVPLARRNPKEVFTPTPEFLAHHVKTRIFSDIWLPTYAVWNLDPLTRSNMPLSMFSQYPSEPDNEIFRQFMHFLKDEFYQSDYRHVIYLTILGHIGNRVDEENTGIPKSLSKTLSRIVEIFTQCVWPLIDQNKTHVFIHPDHGTARQAIEWGEATHSGFLWRYDLGKRLQPVPFSDQYPVMTWNRMLATLCEILDVELPRNNGTVLSV